VRELPHDHAAGRGALERIVTGFPAWYLTDLQLGAVVEERIAGAHFASPSVQLDVLPDGTVHVLSTHDQELGGDDGQVYLGCRFPAEAAYAPELARAGLLIGARLAREGVVGRAAVDFVAARDGDDTTGTAATAGDGRWRLFAIEINLRKGGTTHPFSALRNLAPGRYDIDAGRWRCVDGSTRCYVATDNLLDERWRVLTPAAAIRAIEGAGLAFDPTRRIGVILHMLQCLAIDGRCGVVAIAGTHDEADDLRAQVRSALDAAVA
jgi:PGM1 C-terminal domain